MAIDYIAVLSRVAKDLLGEPDKDLSNLYLLCFGRSESNPESARISVCLRRGLWYDFETEKGGHLHDFVIYKQDTTGAKTRDEAQAWLQRKGYVNGAAPGPKTADEPPNEVELRLRLKAHGYNPLPVEGKRPPMEKWQTKIDVHDDEIRLWSKSWHLAHSTGILTQRVPTIDIDILNPEAAEAVEDLVRGRFEERGNILVRIGKAPKRAIPFRTDTPFKKITGNLVAPDGSTDQKIELLSDGQQFVGFGLHKDTGQPYRWHGGSPEDTPRDALPYIHEQEARDLVNAAVDLLVRDFGYQRAKERPKETKANGQDHPGGAADWGYLIENIHAGRDLHNSTLVLAAKLIAAGMGEGAAVNIIRGAMEQSQAPRDDRFEARLGDIPRIVRGMTEKPREPKPGEQPKLVIKTSGQFIAGFVPPDYVVDGLLQQSFLYSLTGQTGAGKTSIALRLAASVALAPIGGGDPCVTQFIDMTFGNRECKRGRVLYLACENPDDVRMRWIALAPRMGFDPDKIDVFFTDVRFTISKMTAVITSELQRHGGTFVLVIIDTGPAFFEGDDESNRTQMLAHAKMFRGLIDIIPGRPCIVVNCHPVKNATADNLLPAGGGTFLNEMDGNLTAAKTESTVELHWQGKYRGPDFAPMHFMIKTITDERLKDSKGRLISTCMCEFITEQATETIATTRVANEDKVLELINRNRKVSLAGIAVAMGWKYQNGDPDKSKAQRCVDALVADKLIKKGRRGFTITPEGKKVLDGDEDE
jgi:hypothetical protein